MGDNVYSIIGVRSPSDSKTERLSTTAAKATFYLKKWILIRFLISHMALLSKVIDPDMSYEAFRKELYTKFEFMFSALIYLNDLNKSSIKRLII